MARALNDALDKLSEMFSSGVTDGLVAAKSVVSKIEPPEVASKAVATAQGHAELHAQMVEVIPVSCATLYEPPPRFSLLELSLFSPCHRPSCMRSRKNSKRQRKILTSKHSQFRTVGCHTCLFISLHGHQNSVHRCALLQSWLRLVHSGGNIPTLSWLALLCFSQPHRSSFVRLLGIILDMNYCRYSDRS